MKRLVRLLVIALVAAAGGACDNSESSPQHSTAPASRPSVPDDVTLEQVYARMLQALDNGVVHVTITSEVESKLFEDYALDNNDLLTEIWFDVEKEAARPLRKYGASGTLEFHDVILSGDAMGGARR